MGNNCAILMLEDKDLKFVSHSLELGIGASAGLGTVGGSATAAMSNQKRNSSSEVVIQQFNMCTKHFMENSERLLPPSPTFTDLSSTRFGGSGESDGIWVTKKTKLVA
jgi:hypothetical protein